MYLPQACFAVEYGRLPDLDHLIPHRSHHGLQDEIGSVSRLKISAAARMRKARLSVRTCRAVLREEALIVLTSDASSGPLFRYLKRGPVAKRGVVPSENT